MGELRWLAPEEVAELEPAVSCVGAVLSESTGIIDSHAYMESLVGDLEATAASSHSIPRWSRELQTGRIRVETNDVELDAGVRGERSWTRRAGPRTTARAASGGGYTGAYYAKGQYYTLSGRSPFRRLVYPVAEQGGLGVHVTLDLAGQARFGPDVVWINGVDYTFDERNRARFVTAIRRYYPALDEARLQPGYTGIRPKISGPAEAAADFLIAGPERHGVAGLVHLLGVESPGLTASLALAEDVLRARRAALMLRVGVIVNPIAGIGGPAALKGSDGADMQAEALARGSRPRASQRMRDALAPLRSRAAELEFVTWGGAMGADALTALGFDATVLGVPRSPTSAADTRSAAAALCGAWHRRADVCGRRRHRARSGRSVADVTFPVIGVPAGVKMHSGVFTVTPRDAANLIALILDGGLVAADTAEVRDIDEAALREGRIATRYYGELALPRIGGYLQHVKTSGREVEELGARGNRRRRSRSGRLRIAAHSCSGQAARWRRSNDGSAWSRTLLGFDLMRQTGRWYRRRCGRTRDGMSMRTRWWCSASRAVRDF